MEILFGVFSGIISGTGMGGGTFLIFLLTHILEVEYHVAQGTNLIFFIPTSIVAIIINIRNKNIDMKIAILISIFGVIGAIIGANISIYLNIELVKKIFGIFLIIVAIHEIYTIYNLYKNEGKM